MHYSGDWKQLSPKLRRFVHIWEPRNTDSAPPQGVVCIVHGLGEHGWRYDRLAQDLIKQDFAVVAFDQAGHGHSPEQRGCISSYDSLLDDIGELLVWTEQRYERPATLLGHSMGGNLVLNYAIRRASPSAALAARLYRPE